MKAIYKHINLKTIIHSLKFLCRRQHRNTNTIHRSARITNKDEKR